MHRGASRPERCSDELPYGRDAITNIISPLMPYLPIIVVFAQKYDRKAGIETNLAAMLLYSIAFLLGWTVMLLAWVYLGVPLGPGASARY